MGFGVLDIKVEVSHSITPPAVSTIRISVDWKAGLDESVGVKKPAMARTDDEKFASVPIVKACLLGGKSFVVESTGKGRDFARLKMNEQMCTGESHPDGVVWYAPRRIRRLKAGPRHRYCGP